MGSKTQLHISKNPNASPKPWRAEDHDDRTMDNSSVCGECKLKPWKYKCPGCSIRSCGLPCVKAHKQRTGCTGKRKVTDFVTLSHFDDSLLLSGIISLLISCKCRERESVSFLILILFCMIRLQNAGGDKESSRVC